MNDPGNCWRNVDPNGVTTAPVICRPADLRRAEQDAGLVDPLTTELICAAHVFGPCSGNAGELGYPRTQVTLCRFPRSLRCTTLARACPSIRGVRRGAATGPRLEHEAERSSSPP
jgi:hypothetical protein